MICSCAADSTFFRTFARHCRMLLSLLCGLVESTAESAGETPTRYAGYLGVLGAVALSVGDLSALIGLGVETMDELSTMAKLLLPTINNRDRVHDCFRHDPSPQILAHEDGTFRVQF